MSLAGFAAAVFMWGLVVAATVWPRIVITVCVLLAVGAMFIGSEAE